MTGLAPTVPAATALRSGSKWTYRRLGLSNLLHMGHCAPAVMKTILDLKDSQKEWLVRMMAGLPGGVGNTGYECGGITSPLVQFGLEYGLSTDPDGLPEVIHAGHNYAQWFKIRHKSLLCQEILGDRGVPLPCIKVVCLAPELYGQTVRERGNKAISDETRDAFLLLYSHLRANDFHCAHAVLKRMESSIPVTPEMLDGTSGFIAGTAFKGLTCSAFSAGLMAVGLKLGEIEDSFARVMRMLAIMIAGGNAMADHLNKFNRLVNIGHMMAKWFAGEFGSTLCRDLVQCDFSSQADVQKYIEKGSVATCKLIAERVAQQAEGIIKQNGAQHRFHA